MQTVEMILRYSRITCASLRRYIIQSSITVEANKSQQFIKQPEFIKSYKICCSIRKSGQQIKITIQLCKLVDVIHCIAVS